MTFPFPGIDTSNQPLIDAWWTPKWTAQNQSYLPVPAGSFGEQGFPPNLVYVTVVGNFFDLDGNPLSGCLSFWPSSALTIAETGGVAYLPQRFAGTNLTQLGLNQFGNGKIYLWNGQLVVTLLATDQPNVTMTPNGFTYQVKESFFEGNTYSIQVPSSLVGTTPDIHSLIVPGTMDVSGQLNTFTLAKISTQFIPVDLTAVASGTIVNPSSFEVDFAFMSTPTEPGNSDWHQGVWATTSPPYVAQILVGPDNGGLNLAVGSYNIWARIIATPQKPAVQVGTLVIF